MKHTLLSTFSILLSLLLLSGGCDKSANQWEADTSHAALFRPLVFEQQALSATSIVIKYNKIINATRYIFEFTEGEEAATSATYEIPADTLTPYSATTDAVKTEYRTQFGGLNSSTTYTVRMKGTNETTGLESQYVSFSFTTPTEQLIKKTSHGVDYITVDWEANAEVTRLVLYQYDANTASYLYTKETALTEEEKAAGTATLSGLEANTHYRITLNNGEAVRGTKEVKTDGRGGGTQVKVSPDDNIAVVINNCLMQDIADIVLMFEGGHTYELGSINLPYGIENLTFAGDTSNGAAQPVFRLSSVAFAMSPLQMICFQDAVVEGNSSNYMMSLGGGKGPTSISFVRCHVRDYGRCVVRITSGYERETDRISFEGCILENIGANGYGLLNFPSKLPAFGVVSFSNCTLINMGTNLYSGSSSIEEFLMEYCTVYNSTVTLNQLVRFDALPASVSIRHCIFSGTNNGSTLKAGHSKYTTFDYADGCYVTAELKVDENSPFTGSTAYPGTATDLFQDPENGDFHIKDTSFAGMNQAGDSRWWNQ